MSIHIANAAGFWGDDERAPRRTFDQAETLDYLTMDYLAEVTMAVLARQEGSDPDRGYATDFPALVADILADAIDRGVRIVANAGGVNPSGCRDAVLDVAHDQGLDATIATVSGDDFRNRIGAFDDGELEHAYDGSPLPDDATVISANAYFGAFPIAEALDAGADVVVTGRVVDAALTLGPLIHEYGWSRSDSDELARGLVAGHVIECGAQATGGNHLGDWQDVDFERIGFPIAAVDGDGSVVITKPPGTGGKVTPATVAEQLLYEVEDPANYHAPDVRADFQDVTTERAGADRVTVGGIEGSAPTETYKASLHYEDGWLTRGGLVYAGPDAEAKAERAFDYLEAEIESRGIECDRFRTETLGTSGGREDDAGCEPREVIARAGVHTHRKADGVRFGGLFANLGLGGPPAVTLLTAGRPSPDPMVRYHPVLVPKSKFDPQVEVTAA